MDWENLQLGITGKTVMSPLQTEFLASTYFSMTLGWGCGLTGAVKSEGVKQVRKMFPLHLMLFPREFSSHHPVFGWKMAQSLVKSGPGCRCGMAMRHTDRPGTLHATVATYAETQRLSTSWGIAPLLTQSLLGS